MTRIQATTTPDHVWPEIWIKIEKSAQKKKGKEEWAKGKPKLDNARKMTGIYFIDPEDKKYKETIKKCEKEAGKTPPEAPVHCKSEQKLHQAHKKTGAKLKASEEVPQTKYACIVESLESARQRVELSVPKLHEAHVAGKG